MRSGAAHDHVGYFHEAAFYGSDEEFVAIVEPFLREGIAAGEPTLVACAARNVALLRDAVSGLEGISFVPGEQRYQSPGKTIATYRRIFAEFVADGAEQIRVVGDVPHPGVGVPWDSWARYEAAVNHAYNDFPLWGMCPYDTRSTPDFVLDEVRQTHPNVATPAGPIRNGGFEEPRHFLRNRPRAATDPIETTLPDAELFCPTSAEARGLVERVSDHSSLDRETVSDLVLAVSEIVANSIRHGAHPHRIRGWARKQRIIVTVADAGPGPLDPFLGRVEPDVHSPSGRGLWIAHQICSDVVLRANDDGFTVRLTAGSVV